MIIFDVPLEPCAKGRPRVTRHGHTYTPQKTKDFEHDFISLSSEFAPTEPMPGPLKLTLYFHLKKPKKPKADKPITRPDIDNYGKSVMDAMNGIFYHDDSQITILFMYKVYLMFGVEPFISVKLEADE